MDTSKILENLMLGINGQEEQRYFLRYELQNAITNVIRERESSLPDAEMRKIFEIWCEEEDGNLALDRLINLIIYS